MEAGRCAKPGKYPWGTRGSRVDEPHQLLVTAAHVIVQA